MDISPKFKFIVIATACVSILGLWGYFFWYTRYSVDTDKGQYLTGSTQEVSLSLTGNLISHNPQIQANTASGQTTTISGTTMEYLTIYLPETWYTAGRSRIIDELKHYNITLSIVTYRGLFFQDKIIDQDILDSTIDVILIDTDHIDRFSGRAQGFAREDNFDTFVHHSLKPILSQYPYFVPWGIDPALILTDHKIDLPVTMKYIQHMQSIGDPQAKVYIPVLIGDKSGDRQMIQNKTHPIIDDHLLDRITSYNSTKAQYRITTQNVLDQTSKYRSDNYLLKLQSYLAKKNPNCMDTMGLCMLHQGMTDMMFGFWSDNRAYQDITNEEAQISLFPHRSESYPCKARGFVIRKDSPHKKQALTLLKLLTTHINNLDFELYNGNFSAYQEMLAIQTQSQKRQIRKDILTSCSLFTHLAVK